MLSFICLVYILYFGFNYLALYVWVLFVQLYVFCFMYLMKGGIYMYTAEVDKKIKNLASDIYDKLVAVRRQLHKYPELGFDTYKTADFIANYLVNMGIEAYKVMSGAGVVGLIHGTHSLDEFSNSCDAGITEKNLISTSDKFGKVKTIALRADIDALPVNEENTFDYKSRVPGVMHACGHDFHIACLLGAAEILNNLRHYFKGNVKLLFQPGEESVSGAPKMINEGVLENPDVDACIAAHVWPDIPCGKIGIVHGPSFATLNHFIISVHGKGGHGALPHQTIDPIIIGCNIVNSLQTIVSRKVNAFDPAVISVCSFNAGTSVNIIPDTAVLKGTIRTFDISLRKQLEKLICEISQGIAKSMGAEAFVEFIYEAPPVINDSKITDLFIDSASKLISKDDIITNIRPAMVSEDFAFFAERVPSTYFYLGCRNEEKDAVYPLHNSKFKADEECIKIGASLFAKFVIDFLHQDYT